ncbi:MAG: hypothetical protein ABMA13_07075 [Chthoniobacteraceae bacterium]
MKSDTRAFTQSHVSRRSFLKAAGISIALPAFESLAASSQAKPPMRMVCNLEEKLKQHRIIETFYIAQMARFMEKLKSPRTERSHLLNETMVFFGSGFGDAARHSNRDLPLVLAGGGFKHGAHLDCKGPGGAQTPLNNLFTTMLQTFGVETNRFNNATGSMSQLRA